MTSFLEFAKQYEEGWSLAAIRTSPVELATQLQNDKLVLAYQPDVPVQKMTRRRDGLYYDQSGKIVGLLQSKTRRTCFVVRPKDSEWCVVFRTIHWLESADIKWVDTAAQRWSSGLKTTSVASCGNHGFRCQVYDSGLLSKEANGLDREKLARVLDELGIVVPLCFIGGDPPHLFATRAVIKTIGRSDRVEFRVATS